ncbi:MAG: protease complex subunit PrcB family protein [Marinobacter sp.]|uniref:protease complex subunit PrcB family protein n=1 Tax=Marinobacter sp. TaxID=50741 RepID=UPI00299EE4F0|nr:protease complex subunit PrcB family protein [Marinobacter sp.]MDX1756493.1 protease complex subunit PrcB family protein [Marinobacter sp.]
MLTIALVVSVMALASACANQSEPQPVTASLARQVTASAHCGLSAPGMLYLSKADDLRRLTELPGQALSPSSLSGLDFSREHLVIVALGQKTTAGYGVSLDFARLSGDELRLEMVLQEPPAGAMVAQVLTTPCVAIAVTSRGWRRLTVAGDGLPSMSRHR